MNDSRADAASARRGRIDPRSRWRLALAVAFLAVPLAWRGPPSAWAPFHEHAVYRLSVDVAGQHLDTKAALARYHLATWHFSAARDENWETNDLRFVTDVITAAEAKTEGPLRVVLEATVNGEPRPPWRLER